MSQQPQALARGRRLPRQLVSAIRSQRAIALTLLSSLSLSTGLSTVAQAQISAPTLDPETERRVYGDGPSQEPPRSQSEVAFCPTLQDFYFRREQAAEQRSEADEALFRAQQVKRRKHLQFERKIKLTRHRIKQLKDSQRRSNDGSLAAQIRDLEVMLTQLEMQQAAVGFDEKLYAKLKEQSGGSYEIFIDKRLANLNNAAIAQFNQGQFDRAKQEFAALTQTARNRNLFTAEVAAIANQAVVHEAQADYVGALELLKQLPGKPQDATSQSRLQLDLGRVYEKLGNYERAQVQYVAALKASQKTNSKTNRETSIANQAAAYSSLGFLHNRQGQYQAALANFEKALKNFDIVRLDARPVLHRREMIWNGLGEAKLGLKDYAGAAHAYAQALQISSEANCQNRLAEAMALQGQGTVLQQQGQGSQALDAYGQAYEIRHGLKDVAGQAETLEGVGQWYADQGQMVLAIVFYKQAVANLEKVRQNIETLSLDEQAVYERSVQQTYRQLVDLLLQQDRVLEAQEVLELLKIQQLHEFFKDVRDRPKSGTLFFWPEEKQLFAQFKALKPGSLAQFSSIAQADNITKMQERSRLQILNKELLSVLQQNLKGIAEDSALFYPIVLPDRVELLLIPEDGEFIREEVRISKQALNQKVSAFRNEIGQQSGKNPAQKAKALYQVLLAPLEDELEAQGIETLIYASDSDLRYVPLGALFDGEQWLIERFTINNITAASLTDFATSSLGTGIGSILAGAYTDKGPRYSFSVAGKKFAFKGLKYAKPEVDTVSRFGAGNSVLTDQEFNRHSLEQKVNSHDVIHLATHAKFVSNSPDDSFILMGNGSDRISLRELDQLNLSRAELMVLSACETSASSDFDDRDAILGFGYQAQRTGLRATVTTIWPAKDASTSRLMVEFYAGIQNDKLSYSAALRQAQISLATGRLLSGELVSRDYLNPKKEVYEADYSHPFFWAPFLLIGNGL